MSYEKICDSIIQLHTSIRFAGVANKHGKIINFKYRENVEPLMAKTQSELSVMNSLIWENLREDVERNLGRMLFGFAAYEWVKRATVPIRDPENHLILVSFDTEAEAESIITKLIIPLVERFQAQSVS